MAITKILHMKEGKKNKGKHLQQAIDYILKDEKTESGRYISGINCQPAFAYKQMCQTKEQFNKTDKRQGYHIIISFEEGEITPKKAFEVIGRFAEEYLGKEYQAVYAVHTDTAHIHGHIIFNSVSFLSGKKYRYEKGDWAKYIQPITNRLCEEYGLSTITIEDEKTKEESHDSYEDVEDKRTKEKAYPINTDNEWVNYRNGQYIWSDMIRRDVDACILQAESFDEFLKMLTDKGYEIKQNKYLAIKPKGMRRFRRCKSLGEEYTEERIRQRILSEALGISNLKENGEHQPAEIMWVKVPYHLKRAKLSGVQRKYFAKLYRTGLLKKKPYSEAWKCRDDIRKMYKLHAQYLFLADHEIHSRTELEATIRELELISRSQADRRSEIYRKRNRLKPLFAIVREMETLQPGYMSFLEGDDFFKEEYEAYLKKNAELAAEGYTMKELKDLQEHYRYQNKEVWADLKSTLRELDAAKSILEDMEHMEGVTVPEKQTDELSQLLQEMKAAADKDIEAIKGSDRDMRENPEQTRQRVKGGR